MYAHLYADFRFVRIAGFHLAMFICGGKRGDPVPSADEKVAAIRHVDKLLKDLMSKGIGFKDFWETSKLTESLRRLKKEIDAMKTVRAERKDRSKPYRDLLKRVASDLQRCFGEKSGVLVMSLLAIVGSELEERAVRGHLTAI